MLMIRLRNATPRDHDAVREVHMLAFAGDEAEPVAKLACGLLSEVSVPPTLNIIAESGGDVIGHVAFSPVSLDGCGDLVGYLLAPLGVRPERQKRGVGMRLVEEGIARLRAGGVDLVLVYGDPAYYGRFGFDTAAAFTPPYALRYPFGWLALSLSNNSPVDPTVRVSCIGPLCNPVLW